MSTLKKRAETLAAARTNAPKTLAEQISALGIVVPDQREIPRMMEATRLGLRHTASRRRCKWAWIRRINAHPYDVFAYDDHVRSLGYSRGGPVPDQVCDEAELIRTSIPDAELKVHATYDDPWLEVRLGNESVFTRCWVRKSARHSVKVVV